MGDFFSSLISAGGNLLGGLLGRSSQEKINQENINAANQARNNYIPNLVAQARAAGINPLAALGVSIPGPAVAVGDNSLGEGVAAAGQDLGRAANALTDQQLKSVQLDNKLKEIKVADAANDFVAKSKVASDIQKRHGQPGAVSVEKPKPLFQTFVDDKGRSFRLPSGDASSAMQNWASMPAQIPIAITQAGDAIQSEWGVLKDAAGSAWRTIFPPGPFPTWHKPGGR